MPLPVIRNFNEASTLDVKKTRDELAQTMKDQNAFSALNTDEKISLFKNYTYFNNTAQYGGGQHDMSRFWKVNGRNYEFMFRTLVENVPNGEDCLQELNQPGLQKMFLPENQWTDEMFQISFRPNDYDKKLKNGGLEKIREERAQAEKERLDRIEREKKEEQEEAERKAKEEQEAREREEKRLKEEAERKAKEEQEAREREEKRKKEEAERKAKEEQEARDREEKRKKEEAERKAKEEQEAKELEEKRLKEEAEKKEREKKAAEERAKKEKELAERKKIEEQKAKELRERQEKEKREARRREEEESLKAEEEKRNEQRKTKKDKTQAKRDIRDFGQKIKNGDTGLTSADGRSIYRSYLAAKVIDKVIDQKADYKPAMKETIENEVFNSRGLQTEMNAIWSSRFSGEEKLALLNSDYILKLAGNKTLTDLTTKAGRDDLDESRKQYNAQFNLLTRKYTERSHVGTMEQKADASVREGEAAKKNVYFGSTQYDEAVTAMGEVRDLCRELKGGKGILSEQEQQRLQEKLTDAEQKIDRYFDRKISRGELTEDGSFTRKTDEKSKRRIGVLKNAKASIREFRETMEMPAPEKNIKNEAKNEVKDISFDTLVSKNQKSVKAEDKKPVKAKKTKTKTTTKTTTIDKGKLTKPSMTKTNY